MAVYTEVSHAALTAFLTGYDLGALIDHQGILSGTENTNYKVETEAGPCILTLFEQRMTSAELPFFMELMQHLAVRGVLCPKPITARNGQVLRTLGNRPATLVNFLPGQSLTRPQPADCAALGRALAGFHLATADFAGTRPNALDLAGWRELAGKIGPCADKARPGLWGELQNAIQATQDEWPSSLPQGIIHADLFPDNVFFEGGQVSGLIDFYFACHDFYAYDLAICLNAWCFEDDVTFNVTKARALLRGYVGVRELSGAEQAALPVLCRGAALRFLLTRLYDWLHGPTGELVRKRDPLAYLKRLNFHAQVSDVGEYGL